MMYEKIQFVTQDGYSLNGRFYPKNASTSVAQKLPILIGAATGIKQGFYQKFAEYLASQGHDVFTFDFRGIGDSLYEAIAQSKATITDWGRYDLPAALETLLTKAQAPQAILLGHSAGGQLLGLMHNHNKVAKVVAVAGSSGNLKGLKGRTKLMAPLMFNVVFPASSLLKGFAATKMFGMGENLPKGVGAEWRRFCSRPGYAINALGNSVHTHFYDAIQTPIVSIHASDDEIATERNVKDFLSTFPTTQTDLITLKPSDYGYKHIGHMAMFKASHHKLWSVIERELRI